MGFITFSLNYYITELQKLESAPAKNDTIYRAKQLQKMLDDLIDEGYTELNEKLEENYCGVSRLKKYLKDNHVKPFSVYRKPIAETDVAYEQQVFELVKAIKDLVGNAKISKNNIDNHFLTELIRFCEWIGYEENTAYIFLLRDTLLPYIYYQNKNRKSIHPWLLGRKTLSVLSGKENADDEIRASIFKALEFGKCSNFEEFCEVVLPEMRVTLKQYPKIESCLTELLNGIKDKRIVVVESGCSGTFPMLIKSLDDRVDIRMYTTYPYLTGIYVDRIFSDKYEENRLFETLYSQDLYFNFSDLRDGRFFVRKCKDKSVTEKSYAEIKFILQ